MKLIILGAGGHARETFCHVKNISPETEIVFFDDVTSSLSIEVLEKQVHVIKSLKEVSDFMLKGFITFTIGVGDPRVKELLVNKALSVGLEPHRTWIHPTATVYTQKIGMGGLVAPGSVVNCNVRIGDYVIVNYNATIGHDTILGDFVTCNPGANVSGNVTVGEGCLIGAGAVIKEKVTICSDVVLGASSCCVQNIQSSGIYIGVPTRKLEDKIL